MTNDPWQDPAWVAYEAHARENLIPMIKGSAITLALLTGSDPDPKQAIELGYMVLLDKPILVVVTPGVRVPDKLMRIADEVVEMGDLNDPATGERMSAALARMQTKLGED